MTNCFMLNVDYLKKAIVTANMLDLEPPDPGQEGEPGERHYGPGQHGPGQPVAEVVEDAEGNVGLGHVGRHCTVGTSQPCVTIISIIYLPAYALCTIEMDFTTTALSRFAKQRLTIT